MADDKVNIQELANKVAAELDADVLLYNGEIARPFDELIIDLCSRRKRRDNVLLLMTTCGGDADAAYRIARCLQSKYKKFIFYVGGFCKSAGTIVVLGANELIFSDHGELGPLDVQMRKKDELFQLQSGFTVMDALTALQDKTFLAFETFFLGIESKSEGAITVKTAGQIATDLAAGVFAPLFGQIDPLHVGEAARALSIARSYGSRLSDASGNWDASSLEQLLSGYPTHGFVVDRTEAEKLFKSVREPSEILNQLGQALGDLSRRPKNIGERPEITFLSDEKETEVQLRLAAVQTGDKEPGDDRQAAR